MNNEETPRSIRFPKELWDAIDRDAKRCKRSSVKQMEALLLTYYELEEVEIDKEKLSRIREPRAEIVRYEQADSIPVLGKDDVTDKPIAGKKKRSMEAF